MKFFTFLLSVLLIASGSLSAQSERNLCLTPEPNEEQAKFVYESIQSMKNSRVQKVEGKLMIPVKWHIFGDNDGNGYYKASYLIQQMADLNSDFDSSGLYFYIYKDINYVNSDKYYNVTDRSIINEIYNNFDVPGVFNAYVCGNLQGLCGSSSFTWMSSEGTVLNSACMNPGDMTFSHEAGHFFNLFHTFQGGNELVTREPGKRNCETTADGFCDTEADPSTSRASCPYTGTATDANGDVYDPDETLIMSYFSDFCVNRFSTQENEFMLSTTLAQRSYLMDKTPPDTFNIRLSKPNLYYPADKAQSIYPSQVTLQWNSQSDAYAYNLILVGNGTNLDTLVESNSITFPELRENTEYYWKITPVHRAYTYQPGWVSEARTFKTGFTNSLEVKILEKVVPSCTYSADGRIRLEVTGGTKPYTFNWNIGEDTSFINDLGEGIYTVNVSDSTGSAFELDIPLFAEDTIRVDIKEEKGKLIPVIKGGTAPFIHNWNPGENDSILEGTVEGMTYGYTLVDSNSCLAYVSYTATTTGNLQQEPGLEQEFSLYPSLVSGSGKVHIEFTKSPQSKTEIKVYNLTGKKVLESQLETSEKKKSLHLNNINPGIYFLKVTNKETQVTRKITVME